MKKRIIKPKSYRVVYDFENSGIIESFQKPDNDKNFKTYAAAKKALKKYFAEIIENYKSIMKEL